eukprot:symbB.v1.2.020482.t2/scaffold1729.1/size181395/19
MPRPVPMALDSDAEDASPTTALKEFEAAIGADSGKKAEELRREYAQSWRDSDVELGLKKPKRPMLSASAAAAASDLEKTSGSEGACIASNEEDASFFGEIKTWHILMSIFRCACCCGPRESQLKSVGSSLFSIIHAAMVDTLLKTFNFGRDACSIFDAGLGKFDVAVVCHEVRSVNMQPGETICMTLADAEHRVAGEDFISLKSVGIAKSLQAESVLVLKIWAMLDTPPLSKHAERRPLGEVRIPLKHVGESSSCMLYYTWVNLESAGLNDSVAHLGYGGAFATSSEAFMQNIMSGPRQLYQPKACISMCRSAELAEPDRILWTSDLPRTERINRWGPLLRSQQQHAIMCAAQHLEGTPSNGSESSLQRLLHLRAQAEEQAQEIDSLQEQLQSASRATTAPTSREALDVEPWAALTGDGWRQKPSMTLLEERSTRQLEEVRNAALQSEAQISRRGKEAEAQKELEEQRSIEAELQSELRAGEVELAKIAEEANNKIEAANLRIRSLRRERDEAQRALEERRQGNQKLQSMLEEMEQEKGQLVEQKEAQPLSNKTCWLHHSTDSHLQALIRIVEDLHSSCTQAGLPATDRASIDSITGFKMPS